MGDGSTSGIVVLAIMCGGMLTIAMLLRAAFARRGSGPLAQRRFRRMHGARVVELLGGRLDPTQGSVWIDTFVDERPVQLTAAPVGGRWQAGVQLLGHDLPVNVFHTTGEDDELEVPPGIDVAAVRAIVERLRDAGVVSVASPAPIDADPAPPHLLRFDFDDVEELPRRIEAIGALLRDLESLDPA